MQEKGTEGTDKRAELDSTGLDWTGLNWAEFHMDETKQMKDGAEEMAIMEADAAVTLVM